MADASSLFKFHQVLDPASGLFWLITKPALAPETGDFAYWFYFRGAVPTDVDKPSSAHNWTDTQLISGMKQ